MATAEYRTNQRPPLLVVKKWETCNNFIPNFASGERPKTNHRNTDASSSSVPDNLFLFSFLVTNLFMTMFTVHAYVRIIIIWIKIDAAPLVTADHHVFALLDRVDAEGERKTGKSVCNLCPAKMKFHILVFIPVRERFYDFSWHCQFVIKTEPKKDSSEHAHESKWCRLELPKCICGKQEGGSILNFSWSIFPRKINWNYVWATI